MPQMSDCEVERLAHPDYWDERYSRVNPDERAASHEWFRSFADLEPFFEKNLFQRPARETRILHLGSGDSTVPESLAAKGFSDQLCADFSPVVVQMMSKRHAQLDGIEWRQMDVRNMDTVPSSSVDVAFDKGTLDAMIHGDPWNPPEDVLENTSQYMREVFRVLKPDGVFLYVTYRQPHFVKPLLECRGTEWEIQVDVLGNSEGSFGYHGLTLTRRKVTAAPLKGHM